MYLKNYRCGSFGTPLFACAMALLLGCAVVSPAAHAENDNPIWRLQKKKGLAITQQKSTSSAARKLSDQDDGEPATTNWQTSAGGGGKATTTTQIVNNNSVSPFLSLESSSALRAAETRYARIVAEGGWQQVPGGKYKKGSQSKAIAALNKRLNTEGYLRAEAAKGEFASLYTTATQDAVQRFQRNHGLAVTGSVDNATLKALNVSAQKRLDTIRANLPRVLEYSKDLGPRYVVVNVPAMQIEAIANGRVYSIHNAIVGRPSRPTPVVMTNLSTIKFNPYWNAPASIVERDILPRMLSTGPSKVLDEMNIKVFDGVGGPEVDPDDVNWRRVIVDDYHFRQEPGGANAMATAKIEFPSPFGIYLHDTPEPHLFKTGQRFYSSGCVRVENVAVLLNWILNGQDGIDRARIAGLGETKERLDVQLADAPQLRVTYLTAWPGNNGEVHFRPDVYELDGSGFVLGQPLPVGETTAGLRYVLKPVPRDVAAVDAAEAGGFFNIFSSQRNSDKISGTVAARAPETELENMLNFKKKSAKNKEAATDSNWVSVKQNEAKKPPLKSISKSKKVTTTKSAISCKPDKSGKLPAGCKPPKTAASKPKVKPAAQSPTAAN